MPAARPRKVAASTRTKSPKDAPPRPRKGREVPRPFAFHWGEGQIVEEAAFTGQHTEPAIQLLEYQDGSHGIRFCYYNHDGRFQRSPMMIDSTATLEGLRDALRRTPKLRAMLKGLVP